MDWADEAWLEFCEEENIDPRNVNSLPILKRAWLHGARTGVGKAQELVDETRERFAPLTEAERNG